MGGDGVTLAETIGALEIGAEGVKMAAISVTPLDFAPFVTVGLSSIAPPELRPAAEILADGVLSAIFCLKLLMYPVRVNAGF